MPFDKFKIKIVDEDGGFLGYKCELCGKEIYVMSPYHAMTASSAMTNHIKAKHPKEYTENWSHPPIWRYKNWKEVMEKNDNGTVRWVWKKVSGFTNKEASK